MINKRFIHPHKRIIHKHKFRHAELIRNKSILHDKFQDHEELNKIKDEIKDVISSPAIAQCERCGSDINLEQHYHTKLAIFCIVDIDRNITNSSQEFWEYFTPPHQHNYIDGIQMEEITSGELVYCRLCSEYFQEHYVPEIGFYFIHPVSRAKTPHQLKLGKLIEEQVQLEINNKNFEKHQEIIDCHDQLNKIDKEVSPIVECRNCEAMIHLDKDNHSRMTVFSMIEVAPDIQIMDKVIMFLPPKVGEMVYCPKCKEGLSVYIKNQEISNE
jgi:hypothetical protein